MTAALSHPGIRATRDEGPRRGCFVALLGPDGCGKTTLARQVERLWRRAAGAEGGCVHLHGNFGCLPRLRSLRRLWARLNGRALPTGEEPTGRHSDLGMQPHSLIRSLGYVSYYLWDYVLGHAAIAEHTRRGRLVLADRYFHDYLYQLSYANAPHWLLRTYMLFVPRPDLVVYLHRDPRNIYRGKQELTIREIVRQQAILRRLVRRLPNGITLDGDCGVAPAARQLVGRILDIVTRRERAAS